MATKTTTKAVTKPATKATTKNVVKKAATERLTPAPMALIGLPSSENVTPMQAENLSLANKATRINTSAVHAAKLAGLQAAINELKPSQAKGIKTATSKGYGDRLPSAGTSAAAIWQAVAQHTINGVYPTAAAIKALNLTYENKQGVLTNVNPANVQIELNSYKKYYERLKLQTVAAA